MDRDLATLYEIETRVLNQAVKRNMNRFPEDFMFQLNEQEFMSWKSQIVMSNSDRMGLRHAPYAFTEQGVAMLSGLLRTERAIVVNIQIMRAFVAMRRFLVSNMKVFERLDDLEYKQIEMEKTMESLLRRMDNAPAKQGIFYDGQIYDAYVFLSSLVKSAKSRIILIDNYVDETVLVLLDKREDKVQASIYTNTISRKLQLDLIRHNAQYPPISLFSFGLSHDRFLIVDDDIYLIGASLKDAGRKWFGFTKMEDVNLCEMMSRIEQNFALHNQ